MLRFLALALCFAFAPARAQLVAPHAIDIPPWFSQSFLDLREDVAEAAQENKRVMLYFGQDGCPYCAALMRTNFSQPRIVEKTRRHFVSIALNIWGDREITWFDGITRREKEFAAFLKLQFTPSLLFLDERGKVVARLNGYYPPHRFEAVLDWVGGHMENKVPLGEYLQSHVRDAASATLHDEPFFMHAAARPAARQGREAARGRVRDALLRRLRRAAPRRLPAAGGQSAAGEDSTWRESRSCRMKRSSPRMEKPSPRQNSHDC